MNFDWQFTKMFRKIGNIYSIFDEGLTTINAGKLVPVSRRTQLYNNTVG